MKNSYSNKADIASLRATYQDVLDTPPPVESTQNHQGQHYQAIPRKVVRASEPVLDFPDFCLELVVRCGLANSLIGRHDIYNSCGHSTLPQISPLHQ